MTEVDIITTAIENQGIVATLVLLLLYQIREMQKSMDGKIDKMLDAIIAEMRNDSSKSKGDLSKPA